MCAALSLYYLFLSSIVEIDLLFATVTYVSSQSKLLALYLFSSSMSLTAESNPTCSSFLSKKYSSTCSDSNIIFARAKMSPSCEQVAALRLENAGLKGCASAVGLAALCEYQMFQTDCPGLHVSTM
jgi:hypothetical protein